ncbi:MAG: T9SS type A sorting domain-containing protein, partial [Prevotellaceae bacterium]|nr:T9SS type A sorting domain-containing protein [Prevotellaceae bacterium]
TGIGKSEAAPQPYLSVYPNPVGASLNIETVLEPTEVEVYSLAGGKAASYPARGQRTFGVSALPRGSYVVKVIFTNGKTATRQVVVQ